MIPYQRRRAALVLTTALALTTSACRDDASPAADKRADSVPAPTGAARTAPHTPTAKTDARAPGRTATPAPGPTSARAEPTASAAVEPPAAPPEPAVDCDALLTPADVKEACGVEVTAAADQPSDDIGESRTCSRRWSSKDAGALSMLIVRHASAADAKERFDATGTDLAALPDFKAVTGLGDLARRYAKPGASGDPIYSVEAVKGRFDVLVFNPKVTLGPTTIGPACDLDKLEKLAAKVVAKIP